MDFPSLISIFSAPKYARYQNKAAILEYAEGRLNIESYSEEEQPYWLPDFMNVFTWSLPFVATKVSEMLVSVLSVVSEEELNEPLTGEDAILEAKLKEKIRKMNEISQTMKNTRKEMETKKVGRAITSRKESVIDYDGLGSAEAEIQGKSESFEEAKDDDFENEKMPELPEEEPIAIGSRGAGWRKISRSLDRSRSFCDL